MSWAWERVRTVALFLAVCGGVLAACGGGESARVPASASPGPALTLERFLRAANANDLGVMTELFGSTSATIVELDRSQTKAEQRMMVLASLLRHQDWSIRGQRTVPGRNYEATELLVSLQIQDRTVQVPFLVVRTREGGWRIERIDVEPLTSGGGGQ